MNEWMNEWTNDERMNERMSAWMKEEKPGEKQRKTVLMIVTIPQHLQSYYTRQK